MLGDGASLNTFMRPYRLERNYKHSTLNAVAARLLSAVPSQRISQIKTTLSISSGSARRHILPSSPDVYHSPQILLFRIERICAKLRPTGGFL